MLRIAFRTLVAVLCVGLLGAGAAVASAAFTGGPYPPVEFNFNPNNGNVDPTSTVQLLSVTTAGADATSGTQTWTYKVSSGAGPAISHWSIGTCDEKVNGQYVFSSDDVASVSESPWEVLGDDPSTSIVESRILKLDKGYSDYETRTVVITLKGWWPIDEAGTAVVVKAGTQSIQESVPGPGCPKPNLHIEKSNAAAGNPDVVLGDTVAYTIKVTNDSQVPVKQADVHVKDPAASASDLVLKTADADGYLSYGETWEYALADGPVSMQAEDCQPVVNTAKVYMGYSDTPASTSTVTTYVNCNADLGVEKTASLASAIPGQTIDYTVTVTNHGPAAVPFADIVVSDPNATLTLQGPAPAMLAAGDHVTYTASHKVTEAECGADVQNTATVSLAQGSLLSDGYAANDSSSVSTQVDCTADVGITKTASLASAIPGQTIDYTVTVTNNGPAPVSFADIVVTDPNATLTLQGEAPAMLAAGDHVTYTASHQVTEADCAADVQNTASVALAQGSKLGDTNPENDSATVTTTVNCNADLSITKTASVATATSGDTVTYTIKVTNNGPASVPFSSIVVSDPMGTPTLVGPAPASLAAGESLTYTLPHAVTAAECNTNVVNTATVALAPGSKLVDAAGNNSASANVAVTCTTPPVTPPVTPPTTPPTTPPNTPPTTPPSATPPASPPVTPPVEIAGGPVSPIRTTLAIVKRGPARATAGQVITYTITVRNRGRVRARSVVVRDILPPSMSLPRQTATVKLSKGTAVVSLGNLAPGASKTIKVRVRIDRGASGLRTNFATASAANAATVRASARTVIAPLKRIVVPAVTG